MVNKMAFKTWPEVVKGKSPEQLQKIYRDLSRHSDDDLKFEPAQYDWFKKMQSRESKPSNSKNEKKEKIKKPVLLNWQKKYRGVF